MTLIQGVRQSLARPGSSYETFPNTLRQGILLDRSHLLLCAGIGLLGGPCQEFPGKVIDRCGKRALDHDHLEALIRQTYLSDQALRIVEPLLGPNVALSIPAGPLRARHEKDLAGPGLEGLKKMQGLYPPAAGQGEEPDPAAGFLLDRSSADILFRIELPAEEYRYMCLCLIGCHPLAFAKKGRPEGRPCPFAPERGRVPSIIL